MPPVQDPYGFNFEKDIQWGLNLGAIFFQCMALGFDDFRHACSFQWQRLLNKCFIIKMLMTCVPSESEAHIEQEEIVIWVNNVKLELKNECLEFFKRFESLDYWVRMYAWENSIADEDYPKGSGRCWLA